VIGGILSSGQETGVCVCVWGGGGPLYLTCDSTVIDIPHSWSNKQGLHRHQISERKNTISIQLVCAL